MTGIAVTANEYLDRRLAAWREYERSGLIRYDCVTRLVNINHRAVTVVAAFGFR